MTEKSKELRGVDQERSTARTGTPTASPLPSEIEGIIEELLWARYNDVVEGTVETAREILGRYLDEAEQEGIRVMARVVSAKQCRS